MGYYFPGQGGIGLPRVSQAAHDVNLADSFNAPLEMMMDDWVESQIRVLRICLP